MLVLANIGPPFSPLPRLRAQYATATIRRAVRQANGRALTASNEVGGEPLGRPEACWEARWRPTTARSCAASETRTSG